MRILKFAIPAVVIVFIAAVAYFFVHNTPEGVLVATGLAEPQQALFKNTEAYFAQPEADFSLYPPKATVVRGVYVSATHAGMDTYLDPLLELCRQTEINAMVIDVKTDDGTVTFKGIPAADSIGMSSPYIGDIGALMEKLSENGVYPIARVVAFKDNGANEAHPDLYIKNTDGSLWRDNSSQKSTWLNPYNKASWDYVLDIAKGAAQAGFKEIQFDYIRFDTSSRLNGADFGDTEGKSRTDIITEFTKYAAEALHEYGVFVAADVYGTIIESKIDSDIVGQNYVEMSRYLDYICPMVYPSHYADGSFGVTYPDLDPYAIIKNSMDGSNKVLADTENHAIVRPWIQGFTASWLRHYIPYGDNELRTQEKAVYDAGLTEWLVWNPSSRYSAGAYEPR
ncbi:hypothetical protein AGMMS49975_05020 [Clostridia bacterium]|nr:hypothetical protein AGMMS49975_05020 [Clostridia bacterium]